MGVSPFAPTNPKLLAASPAIPFPTPTNNMGGSNEQSAASGMGRSSSVVQPAGMAQSLARNVSVTSTSNSHLTGRKKLASKLLEE